MDQRDIQQWLLRRIAAETGLPVDAIAVDQPFSAHHLDSVKLAAIAEDLQRHTSLPIDATTAYEFPTIATLAAHLAAAGDAPRTRRRDAGRAGMVNPPRPQAPVAIVGLACRFPRAPDAHRFWALLDGGVDAIGPAPDGSRSGTSNLSLGGFLDDVDRFDARFFGVNAEEARRMDPQQRLLLETCWDALEDAGEVPERLRGSATGVYVGISTNDYGTRQWRDAAAVGAYTATGNALAVAANRLSYTFDLRGPSMAVDTACSSSLVATHLALRALRAGECDRVLVAGVNLLLEPAVSASLRQAGMLAPDGRCKAFDARADGYVRGEGCGVIILQPLDDALASGSRVYAVIRGSAVNQDGASNGLTAPNPAAQRDVLRAAYDDAGVEPQAVDYVECHGTGTLLGDPVEARSIGEVLGRGRHPDRPCVIGSVKSNIGHLEAAAGIAGLIKVALGLHHGRIPASLHFATPNPLIPFAELGLRVQTATAPWRAGGDVRVAGVSSFGFGGTNAHVVLEGAPQAQPPRQRVGPVALPVSARDHAALREHLDAWAQRLAAAGPEETAALAFTAATRRTHHRPHRRVIVAPVADLAERVARAAGDRDAGEEPRPAPRVAFVYSGQGAQWPGMARALLDQHPLFASAIRRCDELIADEAGWSVEAVLRGTDPRSLRDTAVAQPVLVALQLALTTVWEALGVVPAAVAGHSVGEIAAAVTADMLDPHDGLRLAVRRGRSMSATHDTGRMLAVALDRDATSEWLERLGPGLALAAVNGPRSCVVAGEVTAVERLRVALIDHDVGARLLDVAYGFHSPLMDGAAHTLAGDPSSPGGAVPRIPFYSTVLGHRMDRAPDAPYWRRNVRDTVEFASAVHRMLDDGFDAFVELGPHRALRGPLQHIGARVVLHSLERGRDDLQQLLEAAGRLYELGHQVRWDTWYPDGGQVTTPPPHPWQRERYWIDPPAQGPHAVPTTDHPLLGARVDLAHDDGRIIWQGIVGTDTLPALGDHRVGGSVVLPAAAYVEAAVAAGTRAGMSDAVAVEDLQMHELLVVDPAVTVQTTLWPDEQGYRFSLHSRRGEPDGGDSWVLHASARVQALAAMPDPVVGTRRNGDAATRQRSMSTGAFYGLLSARGLDYGPAFRVVRDIEGADGEVTGRVDLAAGGAAAALGGTRLIDAGIQLVAAVPAVRAWAEANTAPVVPIAIRRVQCAGPAPSGGTACVALRSAEGDRLVADVVIVAEDARAAVVLDGLELRRSAPARPTAGETQHQTWQYEPRWRRRALAGRATEATHGSWLVLGAPGGIAPEVVDRLARRGVAATHRAVDPLGRAGGGGAGTAAGVIAELEAAGGAPLAGVAVLTDLDSSAGDAGGPGYAEPCTFVLDVVRAVSFARAEAPRLLVVTRRAQPVGDRGDACAAPISAALWGLMKTVPMENPSLTFRCVDVDAGEAAADQIADEMLDASPDAEVGYRDGIRFVRRLALASSAAACADPGAALAHPDGAYVITGGTGGLGLRVAERLVERGAGHVALLARRPGAPAVADAAERWRRRGPEVSVIPTDVRDAGALRAALERVRAGRRPIRGVLHAAGVLGDGAMLDMPDDAVREVLGPKVQGTWNLHALTRDDPLDWFVLFSSAAGVLGSPGQANYGAANAYLDAFAHHRRGLGLPATAIDWGPWDEVGMAAESGADRELRTGARAIAPDDGLDVLEQVVREDRTQLVVLPFDLRNLLQFYPSGSGATFFDEVTTAEVEALHSINVRSSARAATSDAYVAPRNTVERRIAAIWQKSLGIEAVGVHDSFFELGGDSVFGNQILLEINRSLRVKIEPERAFADFTVAGLAALAEEDTVAQLERLTDEDAARMLEQGDR